MQANEKRISAIKQTITPIFDLKVAKFWNRKLKQSTIKMEYSAIVVRHLIMAQQETFTENIEDKIIR